jgi:hypothetical protein
MTIASMILSAAYSSRETEKISVELKKSGGFDLRGAGQHRHIYYTELYRFMQSFLSLFLLLTPYDVVADIITVVIVYNNIMVHRGE